MSSDPPTGGLPFRRTEYLAPIAVVLLTVLVAAAWVGLVRRHRVQRPELEYRLELRLPPAGGNPATR